jgi:hypothetical protein
MAAKFQTPKSEKSEGVLDQPKNLSKQSTITNKRKVGRPSNMNASVAAAVRLLYENGMGKRKIAQKLSIGVGTVMSIL